MSLIPRTPRSAVLILAFRRDGLACVDGGPQTARTPVETIDRIVVIVLALPEPKRDTARRWRALGAAPIANVHDVETVRHTGYPGRVLRVGVGRGGGALVVARVADVVARVGHGGRVRAVAISAAGDDEDAASAVCSTATATAATFAATFAAARTSTGTSTGTFTGTSTAATTATNTDTTRGGYAEGGR